MGKGIAIFFGDAITVEMFLGTDSLGRDVFAAAQTVQGYADDKRQLVRSSDGEQVVSSTTVYTYLNYKPLFTPNSRVTVDGNTSRVISANANGGLSRLRLPDHLSVTLT